MTLCRHHKYHFIFGRHKYIEDFAIEKNTECLNPRGWADTLIFSYIRRLGQFCGVKNFDFQYFFFFFFLGGVRKMNM